MLIYENQKCFNTTINKIDFSIKFESSLSNDLNSILFMSDTLNMRQIEVKLVQELVQLIFNSNTL